MFLPAYNLVLRSARRAVVLFILLLSAGLLKATPANKAALEKYYGKFLSANLAKCSTCHVAKDVKEPESLDDLPHNPFGDRLRAVRKEIGKKDIVQRLEAIAKEDTDKDGQQNHLELLLGTNPGDGAEKPSKADLKLLSKKRAEFKEFASAYRWQPFELVKQPRVPRARNSKWRKNPIDGFVAEQHQKLGLKPRSEAARLTLLRRVYLDVIGLAPTPAEQDAFLADKSSSAYEKVVDRLLDDPRFGERWGRHWMDVWRYSDWAGWSGGNQIRDSKPHIWRWRDWIVESLNQSKPYNQMILEMLAADELYPEDTNALRATGYLARNYKMLSREQWLEDTVKHTAQAFVGVTVGCAKCHNHMTDPISQEEYYQMRAIFEPHHVRTDRIPGEVDTAKAGLVRTFDTATNRATYFFVRGDERKPDTNRVMAPGVPKALSPVSEELVISEINLPFSAAYPDKREFVKRDLLVAAEKAIKSAKDELSKELAKLKKQELEGQLEAEELNEKSDDWTKLAKEISSIQKKIAAKEAQQKLTKATNALAEAEKKKGKIEDARKKVTEAEKELVKAEEALKEEPKTAFKPRKREDFPEISTGRRTAFARWIASTNNPLTARVAANHIWLRHFGRGIITTPHDFGRSGNAPSYPALLDWLAAEFMKSGWNMKHMHRLILTSSTYRMDSTPDKRNSSIDPDNVYLWKAPSRRLEAEIIRDNLLYTSGDLDKTFGGPDIDNNEGLTSKRRSIYLRIAAEKEVEFLKIFDGPTATECYQRRTSVMPQQALALSNSKMALNQARSLAAKLSSEPSDFVRNAFRIILNRDPNREETAACLEFLGQSGSAQRENMILVLYNHNDFVTVR